MSVSYSSIIGHKQPVSLPSVESWGSNMNILRDPPKSLFTRRIDKVGQTSEITEMIDQSGGRIDGLNEYILVYGRGKNPMVSVDYGNYGNNGGQMIGGSNTTGTTRLGSPKQSYLPYRIMNKGAFRPPIRDLRELLPLSRLPRVWTSSFSNPSFSDFSKKAMCTTSDVNAQGVKTTNQMLRPCTTATRTYHLETPIVENYEVKHVIKNPISVPISAYVQPQTRINGDISTPTYNIIENPLKSNTNINMSSEHKLNGANFISTEEYTKDDNKVLKGNYDTNLSQNIQVTSIDELYNVDTSTSTKNTTPIAYLTPQTGQERIEYIHSDPVLSRTLPYHTTHTNLGQSKHIQFEHTNERKYTPNRPVVDISNRNQPRVLKRTDFEDPNNREYKLKPTITQGSMNAIPSIPQAYHDNQDIFIDPHKSAMRQKIYDMQQQRNSDLNSFQYIPHDAPYGDLNRIQIGVEGMPVPV